MLELLDETTGQIFVTSLSVSGEVYRYSAGQYYQGEIS